MENHVSRYVEYIFVLCGNVWYLLEQEHGAAGFVAATHLDLLELLNFILVNVVNSIKSLQLIFSKMSHEAEQTGKLFTLLEFPQWLATLITTKLLKIHYNKLEKLAKSIIFKL